MCNVNTRLRIRALCARAYLGVYGGIKTDGGRSGGGGGGGGY